VGPQLRALVTPTSRKSTLDQARDEVLTGVLPSVDMRRQSAGGCPKEMLVSFVDSLYPLVITGDAVGARDLLLGLEGKELIEAKAWFAKAGRWFDRIVWASDLCEARALRSLLAVKVLRRNPRLADAQKLASSGGVSREGASWRVRGTSQPYYTVGAELTCTCRWEERHHGRRGPCKHILAVLLDREAAGADRSPAGLSVDLAD
jgi:hypothetical protein